MGGGENLDFGAEEAAVAEVDRGAVEDDAVKIDVEVVACVDVVAVVAAEVGADFAVAADAAEEGFDQGLLVGAVGSVAVDLVEELLGAIAHLGEFRIAGEVAIAGEHMREH